MSTPSARTRVRRSLSRLGVATALIAGLGGSLLAASPASASVTAITDVVINEVESNGDATHGDWIELYNNGLTDVDLSGAILSDNDNTHSFTIPAGTTIAGHSWAAFRVDDPEVTGNFGLGGTDSARLFPAGTTDLSGTPLSSHAWANHAATTYGRNPDGTGSFAVTSGSSFAAQNTFGTTPGDITGIKINEVESNGDTEDGDWIELYNTTSTAVAIAGAILSDNDNTHTFVIPATTLALAANSYVAFRVDDPDVTGNFGLGSADSARLFAPGDITLSTVVDSYSWTSHAVVTWGRDVPGAGTFRNTSVSTFGAANQVGDVNAPTLAGVVINEAKSHGDTTHGDWIELKNTTANPVDLSLAILSDNNNSHVFRIPSGTTLAAGTVKAFRVDNPVLGDGQFGLGDDDSARLFRANASDLTGTPVDVRSWTTHANTSHGLNGSTWTTTNVPTFDGANDFTSPITPDISWIVLSEVESNGDATHGDWVELHNPSTVAIDVSGALISDSDNTHVFTIPAGTSIPAGGYVAFRVDDPAVTGNFGLGQVDAVRLFSSTVTPVTLPTAIPIDHHDWSDHATITYGRTAGGLGNWAQTTAGTFGTANQF